MASNIPEKYTLKKDRYVKVRGGNSRFLDIFCGTCNGHVVLYQKDGSGALLRMYLNRIFAPSELAALQHNGGEKKDMANLQCLKCHTLIGVPMVYELENRLAFRMVHGSFIKKRSNGVYPPPKL